MKGQCVECGGKTTHHCPRCERETCLEHRHRRDMPARKCRIHGLVLDPSRYPYGGGCSVCSREWAESAGRLP
jgi:hypothetical protein